MYRMNEYSPLLEADRKSRNICRRIPSEIAVTSLIVGLFLLVLFLIIVLEKKNSAPAEKPDGLLGLSMRSDKHRSPDEESTKEDSVKNVEDLLSKWRQSYEVDDAFDNMQRFYDTWEAAEKNLNLQRLSPMNADRTVFKGCNNTREKTSARCPFANLHSTLFQSAPVPQAHIHCALIAEEVRRTLGSCIDRSFLPKECKAVWSNECDSTYKYRNVDGSCNNAMHPTWGKSGTPFVRMIAPDYADGVSGPRPSQSNSELPSARLLSQKLYAEKSKPDTDVSYIFLYFGLVVDHEMVDTAINAVGLQCCDEDDKESPKSLPKDCFSIDVPDNDTFYAPLGVKCLNFIRSLPVHGECIGRREQLNRATSFLDGSGIYGSTIPIAKSLRSFKKGQLRTESINNNTFMSLSEGFSCGTPEEALKCFQAGDSRVNMFVGLTAMYTVWYREHNRIAEELHEINPQWTDDTLYEEARRILIAQLQYITFHEFLLTLLGGHTMSNYDLLIDRNQSYNRYDDSIDPSIFNVFGAAAFRFGHSLVQDTVKLMEWNNPKQVLLHQTFVNPQLLYHNGLDCIMNGAASQKVQTVDTYISKEVRNHLFRSYGSDFGSDLAAIGIQRGRDHGLPSYLQWRSVCGLTNVTSWEDLKQVMNSKAAENLKQAYDSLEDIDLIPGALAENHVGGSMVGPTYSCLIGRQFKKTRKGDRFWFETPNQAQSFTPDQLKELYKSSMARIICDNSDDIQQIQLHAFKVKSPENPSKNCQDVPKMDLYKWKAR